MLGVVSAACETMHTYAVPHVSNYFVRCASYHCQLEV